MSAGFSFLDERAKTSRASSRPAEQGTSESGISTLAAGPTDRSAGLTCSGGGLRAVLSHRRTWNPIPPDGNKAKRGKKDAFVPNKVSRQQLIELLPRP